MTAVADDDTPQDPDTPKVIDCMRGVSVGPDDPDVELAEILATLGDDAISDTLARALEQLANDANQD